MTTAQLINSVLSYYLNQGSDSALSDIFSRKKAHFLATKVAEEIWNSAPYWFKYSASTVALTSGEGTLPTDFSDMGQQGRLYVSGSQHQMVRYVPPEILRYQTTNVPQSGIPRIYTFSERTAAGLSKILCWPTDSSTLIISNYVKKTPELIDAPLAPTPTSGAAGLLNGAYTWVVTNVTASGETEAGQVSQSLTVSSKQVSLLIPKSEHLNTLTQRKVYRTAASGYQHKLVASLTVATAPAHLDYTYTDNVADASLGANAPLASAVVSGLEYFPSNFHKSALYDGLAFLYASSQDDGRVPALSAEWEKSVRRMWDEIQAGRGQVHAFPPFPSPSSPSRRGVWDYWTPPS